ncbi:MAG: exodeoxyribonuclease III [Deltaproteobacteria bacterium]|nr:exodeoxyribonuclease III [Deltaproteobacteria bacterium]
MRIASWNVNSIRARGERVKAWLAASSPDVLCVQETKVEDGLFPIGDYEAMGYRCEIHGGRAYNGVAILTRGQPLTDVVRGFGDGGDDAQPRLIAGTVGGVRVINVYVPNGQELGSPAFAYKLEWLARLRRLLEKNHDPAAQPIVLCGDFNVAPEPRDVHDPAAMEGQIHFSADERSAVSVLCDWGLVDTFRIHHQEGGLYSWWDYRQLSFQKNRGLRIDLLLASRALAGRSKACSIDRNERKGKGASDHAPVVASFE